jgi:hypothetical protein
VREDDLQDIKVEACGGDHYRRRERVLAPDPHLTRIGPPLPDRAKLRCGVATVSPSSTMSFIIGPLSGALVAGGVWPLIVIIFYAQ